MNAMSQRRERLHRLLDLARVARGWNRTELGRALGRDPTKLYLDSGNPKLDFLVNLADALEWPVEEVVDALWFEEDPVEKSEAASSAFEALDRQVMKAHSEGRYADMVDLARALNRTAETAEERALACNREAGGWDGLGRYPKALDAVRRGLREAPLSTDLRLRLQGNLANAYYTLWELTPALGAAQVLCDHHHANPPRTPINRKRAAFAHYVRGHTYRRLMQAEPENRSRHAESARADLMHARDLYAALADELNDPALRGIARTCLGGVLESEVELGLREADEAVRTILEGLDEAVDLDAATGDLIESSGWWCVFGGNIALRNLHARDLQRAMAVFTNKALEIAERLDNWALRERVFTMQYALHEAIVDATGFEMQYTIDDEDRRLIAGAMGRFPRFREAGWKILQTAKVVVAN